MRNITCLAALLLVCGAEATVADDGQVDPATLVSLGLGEMTTLSDAQGNQVRGMASSAFASSFSHFSIFLFDPETSTSTTIQKSDFSLITDDNAGMNAASSATATTSAMQSAFTTIIQVDAVEVYRFTLTSGLNLSGMAKATSP